MVQTDIPSPLLFGFFFSYSLDFWIMKLHLWREDWSFWFTTYISFGGFSSKTEILIEGKAPVLLLEADGIFYDCLLRALFLICTLYKRLPVHWIADDCESYFTLACSVKVAATRMSFSKNTFKLDSINFFVGHSREALYDRHISQKARAEFEESTWCFGV